MGLASLVPVPFQVEFERQSPLWTLGGPIRGKQKPEHIMKDGSRNSCPTETIGGSPTSTYVQILTLF